MTRAGDGTTVKLSGGNWAALLLTLSGTLLGQAFMFSSRMVSVETRIAVHEKRLDVGDARDEQTRQEFIGAVNALRVELKKP